MSTRPHFDDLNRRYSETDWVSEYQRLWAIFNHWLVVHVGNSQDRHCIETLKQLPETKVWIDRIIEESSFKRTHRNTEGLANSLPRFTADNVISRLFRDTINSPVIEPRITYPWRPGTESRVRETNSIAIDEEAFMLGYKAHGILLYENMVYDLTFHQTLELGGIHTTGCCFYLATPSTQDAKIYFEHLIDKFRSIPELSKVVSLFDSTQTTTIVEDTIEMLYNVRNTAMHGSLDFLITEDNSAARSASEALDSLIQDIRDNW